MPVPTHAGSVASANSRGGELWHECVEWLIGLGLLDAGAGREFTRPADFAVILRDGVHLCELASLLKAECIRDQQIFIHCNQSPYICSKNIGLFLDACRTHFGLTDAEVFHENDLYELQNFSAVLRTLSLLSHSSHCRRHGIRPFPETPPNVLSGSVSENSLYSNIQVEVEEKSAASKLISPVYYNQRKHEQLYDRILLNQSVQNKTLVPQKYAEFKPSTQYEHCLVELLDTEMKYCETLLTIVEDFYARLHNKLDQRDVRVVFLNIQDIHKLHTNFLKSLGPAVFQALGLTNGEDRVGEIPAAAAAFNNHFATPSSVGGGVSVADVFINHKLNFVCYAEYCAGLKESGKRIDELTRDRADLQQLFTGLGESEFKLRDLLIVPFQRILKYPLLLASLMENCGDALEQQALSQASDAVKDVADFINEVKRDQETIDVVNSIQQSVYFSSDIALQNQSRFVDYGRLIMDGSIKLKLIDHDVKSVKSHKSRYVFLFERRMIVCKEQASGRFEFKHSHDLGEYILFEHNNGMNVLDFLFPSPTTSTASPTTNGSWQNTLTRRFTDTLRARLVDASSPAQILTLVRRNSKTSATNQSAVHQTLQRRHSFLGNGSAGVDASVAQGQAPFVQIICKTTKQRDQWADVIRDAIDRNVPREAISRGHRAITYRTYNFKVAVECAVCKRLLSGKFFQGYHCGGCNRNMHRKCANQRYCIGSPGTPSSERSSFSSALINGTVRPTPKPRRRNHPAAPATALGMRPGDFLLCRRSVSPSSVVAHQKQHPGGPLATAPVRRLSSGEMVELVEASISDGLALIRTVGSASALEQVFAAPLDVLTPVVLSHSSSATLASAASSHPHQSQQESQYYPLPPSSSASSTTTTTTHTRRRSSTASSSTISSAVAYYTGGLNQPIVASPPANATTNTQFGSQSQLQQLPPSVAKPSSATSAAAAAASLVSRAIIDRVFDDDETSLPEASTANTTDLPGSFAADEHQSELERQPWYFGPMERQEAAKMLDGTDDGTFLVRWSASTRNHSLSFRHSISRQNHGSRHAIIFYADAEEEFDGRACFYLNRSLFFASIAALVQYFRRNDLGIALENVKDLKLGGTVLRPGAQFRVLQSYQPNRKSASSGCCNNADGSSSNGGGGDVVADADPKYLRLRLGERVTVIDTSQEHQGWWRGVVEDRIGFFPLSYVQLEGQQPPSQHQQSSSSDATGVTTAFARENESAGGSSHVGHGRSVSPAGGRRKTNFYHRLRLKADDEEAPTRRGCLGGAVVDGGGADDGATSTSSGSCSTDGSCATMNTGGTATTNVPSTPTESRDAAIFVCGGGPPLANSNAQRKSAFFSRNNDAFDADDYNGIAERSSFASAHTDSHDTVFSPLVATTTSGMSSSPPLSSSRHLQRPSSFSSLSSAAWNYANECTPRTHHDAAASAFLHSNQQHSLFVAAASHRPPPASRRSGSVTTTATSDNHFSLSDTVQRQRRDEIGRAEATMPISASVATIRRRFTEGEGGVTPAGVGIGGVNCGSRIETTI